MDERFAELKGGLEEYFAAVEAQKSEDPPDLMAVFQRLDEIEKRVLPHADAELRHFIERKSYRKAYDYLNGVSRTELHDH